MLKDTEEAEFALEADGDALTLDVLVALLLITVGSPYPVILPENGPGRAVATAPIPDRPPTFWEGRAVTASAFAR